MASITTTAIAQGLPFPSPQYAPAVFPLAVAQVGHPEPAPRHVGREFGHHVENLGDSAREQVAAVRLRALQTGVLDDCVAESPVVLARGGVDARDRVQDRECGERVRCSVERAEGGGHCFEILLGELAEGGYVVFVCEDVHIDV